MLYNRSWQLLTLITLSGLLITLPALFTGNLLLALVLVAGLLIAFILLRNPLYPLIAYAALIPVEELIVIDGLGTLTRIAAIAFIAIYLFHRRFSINVRVIPLAGWFYMIWAFTSLIWTVEPTWQFASIMLQLFIMTVLIADYLSRFPNHLRPILNGYTLTSVVIAIIGIVNFFQGIDPASGFTEGARTSGLEGQSVAHFAFYLMTALLYLIHLLLSSTTVTRTKILAASLSPVLILAILLSGTRGAWLAIAGALAIMYAPRMKPRQWLLLMLTAVITIGVALQVPIVSEYVRFRTVEAAETGGAGRLDIWKVGTTIVLDHPLRGVGLAGFDEALNYGRFSRTPFNIYLNEPFKNINAHNIYLEITAELGIIGIIPFLIWMASLIVWRSRDDNQFLAVTLALAMLIGGLTNPALIRKYFWFTIAIAQAYAFIDYQRLKRHQGVKTGYQHTKEPALSRP